MGNVQTRQCDAKGGFNRRGSIAWNFRYPTLRRRDHATMMVFNAKLCIADWLDLLDLQQYENNFQMYNRVEDILELNDNDLKRKGIRNPSHRSKMLSSLVGVQAKRRQSVNIEVSTIPRFVSSRKNSCPPIYLSDTCNLFNTQTTCRSGNRNSLPVVKNISDLKSCKEEESSEESHIYAEIKPPESDQNKSNACITAARPTVNTNATTENSPINTMEIGSSTHMSTSTTATLQAQPHSQSLSSLVQSQSQMHSPSSSSSPSPSQSQIQLQPQKSAQPAPNTILTTTASEHQEAIALKKALEWELSLDSRDLRSHAWYHGPLPRQRAEEIVQREGDFLIRDCASQPANYVLTCRTKSSVLHFVINKIILQPETVYERVQYQFEEDAFDAVPDLITFYVGSGKPISAASGARIQFPCNRTYPLSFYGHKIVGNQLHTQMLAGIRGSSPLNSPLGINGSFRFGTMPTQQQQHQQTQSPMSSPPRSKRDIPPRLPSKKQRSQSLTPAQAMVVSNIKNAEMSSNSDGVQSNNNASGDGVIANGNSFKTGRRFSNFEKCSSLNETPCDMQDLHIRMEQFANSKIHSNGFQTIARCSAASEAIDHVKFTTHSLPRPTTNAYCNNFTRASSLARDLSTDTPSFNTSLEGKQIPELPERPPSPPPKPVRAPTLPRKDKDFTLEQQYALHRAAAAAAYHASGSDSGNGSGDSVHSSIPGDSNEFTVHRGVIIKNPRFMSNSVSSVTLKSLTEFDANAVEKQLFTMDIPEFKPISKFDIENFSTLLLPSVDNKPLDGDALSTFKMMLLETGPKMIAEHIARIDIGLLIDDIVDIADDENTENSVLDCCGLEMLTLPHGKIVRNDLIERTQCIKLMVAVTILTCQTDLDRAELLSKWIQIAVETKTALGNLFGFSAIMLGLCMQQIQKLDQAWHILRQKYTDSAFTFEAKLRPTLISMNECSNPQAPNTTVPHVLLYALLKDRPVMDILSINNAADKPSLYTTCITSWESKADDFGMTINFLHLDSVRSFLQNLTLYRKNAKIVLEESNSRLDELLSDAFRTEFHVKFLWGSKGALATPDDRHSKLEKVLALMADKFCSADNSATNISAGV